MAKYINAAEAAEKVATAYKIPMGDLVDVFAGIPVADVAPVIHAHWVQTSKRVIYCSNCGAVCGIGTHIEEVTEDHHFCYYCGAKLDEEEVP